MTAEDIAKIEEGRRLLKAIGEEVDGKSHFEILRIMADIGLGHLRAMKVQLDTIKAHQEVQRRIQTGPRPTPEEAAQN